MSLFKLKNLWSCSYPEEEFDEKHLSIGKIDGYPALVIGSFKGFVRVYLVLANDSTSDLSLIYENNFDKPVVCVDFVQHPDENKKNTIGVLFYRKFAYINFKKNSETQNYEPYILQLDVEPAFGISRNPISLQTVNSSVQYLNPNSVNNIKVSDPIYPFTRDAEKLYYSDG